jgi:hypothetical protein
VRTNFSAFEINLLKLLFFSLSRSAPVGTPPTRQAKRSAVAPANAHSMPLVRFFFVVILRALSKFQPNLKTILHHRNGSEMRLLTAIESLRSIVRVRAECVAAGRLRRVLGPQRGVQRRHLRLRASELSCWRALSAGRVCVVVARVAVHDVAGAAGRRAALLSQINALFVFRLPSVSISFVCFIFEPFLLERKQIFFRLLINQQTTTTTYCLCV